MKTPLRLGGSVSPDGEAPPDAVNEVDDVLAETVELVEKLNPPHDRWRKLVGEDGPTEMLLNSARRWISTMMADEGIYEPIQRGRRQTKAEIRARTS